jgi:hypothetical protein
MHVIELGHVGLLLGAEQGCGRNPGKESQIFGSKTSYDFGSLWSTSL